MVLYCEDELFIAPYQVSQSNVLESQAGTFLLRCSTENNARSIEIFQGEGAVFNTDIAKPMIIGTTEVPPVTPIANSLLCVLLNRSLSPLILYSLLCS